MYYIRLSDAEGGSLIYYCRNCGHEENIAETNIENLCISKTDVLSNKNPFKHIVNEYTKLDPTLPRVKNMKCPNDGCDTNKKPSDETNDKLIPKKPEIIYLRYDDKNMKFIYLCADCNTTWLSNNK
jgi:DNA-directed RNA polymerase subunit M/transcription elongation factor TFIIS